MKRGLLVLAGLLAAQAVPAAPTVPVKVLVFTLSLGFKHGSIPAAEKAMVELGQRSGLFEAKVSQDVADLAPERLKDYQVVFFYTTGEHPLTAEGKQAFLDWIKAGGGFIGAHCATDTNYRWAEYGEMIGGYFDGHPWTQEVGIKVEDTAHPISQTFDDSFRIREEVYTYRNWSRDQVHVLMSLDNNTVNLQAPGVKRADQDFAVAWCKEYGQGRVFFSGFGHFDEAWTDPRLQAMFLDAIKWECRLDWRSDAALSDLVAKQDAAALAKLVAGRPDVLAVEPVRALAAIPTEAARTEIASLAKQGPSTAVRVEAVRLLGKGEGPVDVLIALAGDPLPEVRVAAVTALGRRRAPEGEAAVTAALKDTAEPVRLAAVQALGKLATPTARQTLLGLIGGPEAALRRPALDCLAGDAEAQAALLELVRTQPTLDVLPAVVDRLAPLAARDDVYAALVALVDGQAAGGAKAAALRAIARSGRADAGPKLAEWVFSPNPEVARAAATATLGLPGLDFGGRLTPFVTRWLVCGPFPNADGKAGHDQAYGPETKVDPAAEYDGAKGAVKWQAVNAANGRLDLRAALKAGNNAVGYAACIIAAPRETACELRLGSDDGGKAWLNGREVFNKNASRGLTVDDDRIPVTLQAGDNLLLVKVVQGSGDWLLTVRLGRAEGGLEGVTFRTP